MIKLQSYILYIYLFFTFFGLFFCGSFIVGPLSIRNYSALLLFATSVFVNRNKFFIDSTVRVFIWYLIILILVNILNGCFDTTHFTRMMLVYQLPSIIVVYSLPKLMKTKRDVLVTMVLIVILFLMNAAITFGQFTGNTTALLISEIIGFDSSNFDGDNRLGSYLGGLTGNVVNNGYFLSTMLPISVMGLWSEKKLFRFFSLGVLAIATYCIYIVQQRTAFIILLLFYTFLILLKRDKYIIAIAVCLLFISINKTNIFTSIDMGRLSLDTSNDDRLLLFENFFRFVKSPDILLGGAQIYYDVYRGGVQHNAFTSALIIGGIPVFITFLWLVFKIFKSLHQFYRNNGNAYYIPLCLGCTAYFLCSMTHSTGIQNGGVLFWVLYGLILSFNNVKNETIISSF